MNNVAIILSGGSGTRIGSNLPKQLLKIDNISVIEHCINAFQESSIINNFIVVSATEYLTETKIIAEKFSKFSGIVNGGKRRQDSVFNGLEYININIKNCNFVFIHDAARPFLSNKMLNRLYDVVKTSDACIPVIPSADTVKIIEDGKVVSTLDRTTLANIQTPQVFNFSMLFELYKKFPETINVTDDAGIFEHFNKEVYVTEGDKENIKITFPIDLVIAETILKKRIN